MPDAAILLCGGSGKRMAGRVTDKILAALAGKPVFQHSVDAFLAAGVVDQFVCVYRDSEQKDALAAILAQTAYARVAVAWAQGGRERQDSVFHGLIEVPLLVDHVYIHDCARPVIHPESLLALRDVLVEDKAAVLAHRVTDTIKKALASQKTTRLRKLKDVPRSSLWAMETPQAFARESILEAYRRLRLAGDSVTDDTAALSTQGFPVSIVENPHPNPKLTTPADLPYLEFLLAQRR